LHVYRLRMAAEDIRKALINRTRDIALQSPHITKHPPAQATSLHGRFLVAKPGVNEVAVPANFALAIHQLPILARAHW